MASNSASVMWPWSRRRASCSICSGTAWPGWRRRHHRGSLLHHRHRHVAGLHLPVDLVLHAVGVADEVEVRLAVLARRLDVEVTGADDAVDEALVEVDVVDALERDLDAALRDHAAAVDHAPAGDHEVGHAPPQVLQPEPHRPRQRHQPDDDAAVLRDPVGVGAQHQDQDDRERDPGEDVAREVPPVRAEIEGDRLAFLDQVVGVRPSREGYAHPSSCRRTSSIPK